MLLKKLVYFRTNQGLS